MFAHYKNGVVVGLFPCAQPDALDDAGNVICPGIPTVELAQGHADLLAYFVSMQPKPPSAIQQIRALEQAHDDDQRKLNRQAAIDTALTVVCRTPQAQGKTRAEVHELWYTANRGYRAMVNLEAQIVELRKLIV